MKTHNIRPLLRLLLLVMPLLALPLAAAAQRTFDAGLAPELSVGFKPWRGAEVEVGQALRLTTAEHLLTRSQTTVGIGQRLLRSRLKPYGWRLKAGAEYSFIYLADDDVHNYLPRHRVNLSLALARRHGDFTLSVRERLKTTWQNPSRAAVNANPKVALTTRLRLAYSPSGSPWSSHLDAEAYLRILHPKGTRFNRLAFRLGAERRLDSRQRISLGLKLYHDLGSKHPESLLLLGAGYHISL